MQTNVAESAKLVYGSTCAVHLSGTRPRRVFPLETLFAIKSPSTMKLPKRRGEYLYGVAPCLAALHAGRRQIFNIFLKSAVGSKASQLKSTALSEVKQYAERKKMDIHYVSRDTLERMSSKRPHQGIVLDVTPVNFSKIDFTHFNNMAGKCAEKPSIWLLLDGVQDPMNFGAILRCVFFLGAEGVLTTTKNCCALTPVVSKASSGAMELMKVFSLSNVPGFLSDAKCHGWDVVGTCSPESVDEKTLLTVQDVCDFILRQPTILVLGNEGYGIRKELSRSCSTLLTVPPMRPLPPGFDSLNVGVATGIILHRLQTNFYRTASKSGTPSKLESL